MRLLLLLAFSLFASAISTAAEPPKLLNRFVPQDVLDAVAAVDPDIREKSCVATLSDRRELAELTPETKLQGLSSQMYDTNYLLRTIDSFSSGLSAVAASALVRDNDADKDFLMSLLSHWADSGAYAKTRDCSVQPGKTCGNEWVSKRGTELTPLKDFQSVEERLVPAAFAYYLILADYKRQELAAEHAKIEKWLGVFLKRLPDTGRSAKAKVFFGFGFNWQTWGYPVADLVAGNEKNFKARLANLADKLDKLVLNDGSLDQRTIRGARGLWYHYAALEEMLFALEMERANDVDLYDKFKDRLDRAIGIFLDGVDDLSAGRNTTDNPARIYKWAKADFHSVADPRVQLFGPDEGNAYGAWGSWMYKYLYRFPDSPVSDRLRALIASYEHLPTRDQSSGVNLGCLYRLAIPELAQREASDHAPISDAQIASLTAAIGAPTPEIASLPLTYDAIFFFNGGSEDNNKYFSVNISGAKLGDKSVGTIGFQILTNFKDKSFSPKSVDLFRIAIDLYALHDPATNPAELKTCSKLAVRPNGVNLHYGAESTDNACVFRGMGESDRQVWQSVLDAFPKLLADNAKEDAVAAEMAKLIAVKLKQK